MYANVTGFEDNEESPVHILLSTHSVTVEVFCVCERLYHDTTPLNFSVKNARRVHLVLDACSTGYIVTNTMISKKNYTRKCVRQCVLLFVSSHVLGWHDVLFVLNPTTLHCVHVGDA